MKPMLGPSLLLLLAAASCRKGTVEPPAPTLPPQAAQLVPDQPPPAPPVVVQAVTPPPPPPPPPPAPAPAPPPIREIFPGVRLDLAARAVEFDGTIVQGGGDGMVTYLEVLVCRPNSREHESIVMSDVLPSHVHAALLLAGALPGKPGSWTYDKDTKILTPHPPAGDMVIVTIAWGEPEARTVRPIAELVRNAKNRSTLASRTPGFVFAGSALLQRRVERRYAADVSGTIIGLCTFGDEPIAWAEIISHEEAVDDPAWVVDPATPSKGTKVVVRVQLPPK
jgi:hypothetical protein